MQLLSHFCRSIILEIINSLDFLLLRHVKEISSLDKALIQHGMLLVGNKLDLEDQRYVSLCLLKSTREVSREEALQVNDINLDFS